MTTTKLAFIPTEQEIGLLISGCGRLTSAVKWTDLDAERNTLTITPEKNSNPRILPISNKPIGMINSLPKNRPTIFQSRKQALRPYLCTQHKALAEKLNNPRLQQISFHTLRHWKGTMEYHKTKDIIHPRTVLGHKCVTCTLIYINLESALLLQTVETSHPKSHTKKKKKQNSQKQDSHTLTTAMD